MATLTDGELWQQAQGGDTAALGELYLRYAPCVHRLCLWRTAAKQLAEDVAATVFLEAWRKRRRLELTTESAAPLLLGLATEVLRGYWRRQRRHARALQLISEADSAPWDEDEIAARVRAMLAVREAGAAIRKLAPREREVIALIEWGGLSCAEAAIALGIPVGAVRARVARSRSRLEDPPAAAGAGADDSLLLPADSTLEARLPALEASCSRRSFSVLAP
jgi:RNA polymerase sigma-70 factor (ECF subfamily)